MKYKQVSKNLQPGPIIESKGIHEIFQKKGKKGQNIWKFGQNCTKHENIMKKGRWFHVIISCNKLLEKALATVYCKLFLITIFSVKEYLSAYLVYTDTLLLVCTGFHLRFSNLYLGLCGFYCNLRVTQMPTYFKRL